MPPKAAAKKGAGGLTAADKERLSLAESEVQSLNRLLGIKVAEAMEARHAERVWRQRAEEAEGKLEQLRADMLDVSADMKRQSEGAQEQLTRRIEELEAQQRDLRQQLEQRDTAISTLQGHMGEAQSSAQERELIHQQHVAQLQAQFAAMLQDTMEKLQQRLEERHTAKGHAPLR